VTEISKPNILFILVDSLRADKVFGKNKTSKIPNIESLIKNGVYFEQTICSTPATGVSLSSIFTGLYPFKIGMGSEKHQKFNPKIRSYIQILKENDYNVYATSPEITNDLGIICDFENPDKSYNNYFSLFAGLGNQIIQKISASYLKKPWFFYIHIFDLHKPVVVPEKFDNKKFGTSQYERMLSAIDFWIGKILEKINLPNTLVIFTADHGEYIPLIKHGDVTINLEPSAAERNLWKWGNKVPQNLSPLKQKLGGLIRTTRNQIKNSKLDHSLFSEYEKRILLHQRQDKGSDLYEDLIRVPLIFSGCGITSNSVISRQIPNVDIFPTILDIIGIESQKKVDGRSLLPIINGKKLRDSFVYIESSPGIGKGKDKVIGIRSSNFKYFRDLNNTGRVLRLYDLKNDPLEENNIANKSKPMLKNLEEELLKIRSGNYEKYEEDEISEEETKAIEEELKKLGYD